MPPSYTKSNRLRRRGVVGARGGKFWFAWSLVALLIGGAQTAALAQDPSCIRRDTFSQLPLSDAAEVATYRELRRAFNDLDIYPSVRECRRFYDACDSLGLRELRVKQAYELIGEYLYRDTGRVELLAMAEDVASNLTVFGPEHIAGAYNSLGNVRSVVDDYARAIEYYLLSYEHCAPTATLDRVYALGNLASTYADAGDTARAIEATYRSYALSSDLPDPQELAYNRTYDCATLARFFVHAADHDSAAHYLAESRRNVDAYDPSYSRYGELLEEYQHAAIPYFIRTGDFAAARLHLDTLATLSPDRAQLLEARLAIARGHRSDAFAKLSASRFEDIRIERERIDLLISLAEELGDYRLGFTQLRQRLAASERETVQMRDALTTVSEASVRNADAQRAALVRQHADELAVLEARQRLYAAGLAITLSLAAALYFFLRYRRSSVRVGDLNALVSTHERDLERANAQLRDRIRGMERYHHLLSHDLREPVRSISGFTKLLGRELAGAGVETTNLPYLNRGVGQLENLLTAIERLREVEEHEPRLARINAAAIARQHAAEAQAQYPDVVFEWAVAAAAEGVRSDATLLSVLVGELVGNACKFSGGEGLIRIAVDCDNDGLRLAVADAGIGIEPTFRARVFEPFKRLNRREDYGGAGVGLTLVQTATRKLGGAVNVDDGIGAGGRGLTVCVTLPDAQGAVASEAKAADQVQHTDALLL